MKRAATAAILVMLASGCGEGAKRFTGDADSDTATVDTVVDTTVPDGVDVPVDLLPDDLEVPPSDCGNGILEGWEQCDDGNTADGDGCSSACLVEPPPHCGDCEVDYDEMEQCDDCNTTPGDGCGATCQREAPPRCGDGHLDIDQGEQCDDGDTLAGDGCSPTCQFELVGAHCGDSTTDTDEACDDGNLANGDACNPTCNLTNTTGLIAGSPGAQGRLDGAGTAARLGGYGTLAADADHVYFADGANHIVRRIEVSTSLVETIAGDEAGGTSAWVDDPVGANARFLGLEACTTRSRSRPWPDRARRRTPTASASRPSSTTCAG
jgi:cysteine-rich repeat protein